MTMKFTGRGQLQQSGKRLYIRPWETSDFKAWKDSEDSMLPPRNEFDFPSARKKEDRTRKEFSKVIRWNNKSIRAGEGCFCGIFLKKSGQQVGTVGLIGITRGSFQTGEIAYRIFSQFWGKGYGREAVLACLKLGFGKLKLHRIEAAIEPINAASIKLAGSAGMKLEGLARKKIFTRKAWRDMLIYSALCTDLGYKPEPPRSKR
ncbi:MAG: GNAT family protein [Elusimicrobia bacterium]|nr:GNAT family protein [Elusimicrobiota bacterium]